MTRWLVAAQKADGSGTKLTKPTEPQSGEVSSIMSVLSGGAKLETDLRPAPAKVECRLTGQPKSGRPAKSAPHTRSRSGPEKSMVAPAGRCAPEMWQHGRSVTGGPLTWTGRVVSLEEWRQMSEWDRRGPNGKVWCGKRKKWIVS